MQLFTYGSLMFAPIWQRVVGPKAAGNRCTCSAAWLAGFRREGVHGAPYPVIVPDAQAPTLEGVLYCGLRRQDLKRLDHFEGHWYQRQTVTVRLLDCQERQAQVYVLKPQWRRLASGRPWYPGQFETQQMRQYLR